MARIYVDGSATINWLKTQPDFPATGTRDDRAIQAALNQLPSGGGDVIIGEGQYNIGASLVIPPNCTLQGAGVGVTVLRAIDSLNASVLVDNSSTASYITIRDLTIDGNGSNQTGTSRHGIMLGTAVNGQAKSAIRLENVEAKNCRGTGIILYGCVDAKLVACRGTGSIGTGGVEGAGLGLVNCGACEIVSPFCDANSRSGIVLANFSLTPGNVRNKVLGGYIGGGVMGVEVDDGADDIILGLTALNCSTAGVSLLGSNHVVDSCHFQASEKGVVSNGATGTLIRGCRFVTMSVLAIQLLGASTCYEVGNLGANRISSGVATILDGATSVTVTHSFPGTPGGVLLGASHAEVADARVESLGATTFAIVVPAAVTADRVVYWQLVP